MSAANERPVEMNLDSFGSSDPAMQRCLHLAKLAAGTDLPILILGESGVGKTLLARAIHASSKRSGADFVSFNAAALSDSLLDSQLFGHEKGAFTSADKRVKGKFELAHSGTLFLDEIADMSMHAQAKILRAIEYGEFQRLGSEEMNYANVRLISATHLPLPQLVERREFRRDLFYRLSGFTITVPPLRERPNDLRSLIAAEAAKAAQLENKEIRGFTRDALNALTGHCWPGNLRELNRIIHIAVAVTKSEIVDADAILIGTGPEVSGGAAFEQSGISSSGQAELEDLSLKAAEIQHILTVLAQLEGNKRQAAKALGISRSTLDRKLADSGVEAC